MAILNILHYPDKRLHKVAKPIVAVDDRVRQLAKDMAETMYEAPGVGLAATQVDVHQRVIVIDVSEESNDFYPRKLYRRSLRQSFDQNGNDF